MDLTTPPPDNWEESIPGDASFDDITRRLSADLQQAATKLLNHLQASSYRTRMTGSPYGTYLTIGSGRYTDEYPVAATQAASTVRPGVDYPSENKHDIPADHRSKLRPVVSSV